MSYPLFPDVPPPQRRRITSGMYNARTGGLLDAAMGDDGEMPPAQMFLPQAPPPPIGGPGTGQGIRAGLGAIGDGGANYAAMMGQPPMPPPPPGLLPLQRPTLNLPQHAYQFQDNPPAPNLIPMPQRNLPADARRAALATGIGALAGGLLGGGFRGVATGGAAAGQGYLSGADQRAQIDAQNVGNRNQLALQQYGIQRQGVDDANGRVYHQMQADNQGDNRLLTQYRLGMDAYNDDQALQQKRDETGRRTEADKAKERKEAMAGALNVAPDQQGAYWSIYGPDNLSRLGIQFKYDENGDITVPSIARSFKPLDPSKVALNNATTDKNIAQGKYYDSKGEAVPLELAARIGRWDTQNSLGKAAQDLRELNGAAQRAYENARTGNVGANGGKGGKLGADPFVTATSYNTKIANIARQRDTLLATAKPRYDQATKQWINPPPEFIDQVNKHAAIYDQTIKTYQDAQQELYARGNRAVGTDGGLGKATVPGGSGDQPMTLPNGGGFFGGGGTSASSLLGTGTNRPAGQVPPMPVLNMNGESPWKKGNGGGSSGGSGGTTAPARQTAPSKPAPSAKRDTSKMSNAELLKMMGSGK
jgi:hypothetical protein